MEDQKQLPAEPLRAYSVDLHFRKRVIATSQEEANAAALRQVLADPKEYICEDNITGTFESDYEMDVEDMEFHLFPSLDPLSERQIEQARIAFEQNQEKINTAGKA